MDSYTANTYSGYSGMVAPLARVRYLNRPAFLLLLATLLGLLLFLLNLLAWGSVVLGLLALVVVAVFRKFGLALLLVWSVLFGWYAQQRTELARTMPLGTTLYDCEVQILYPTASSLQSPLYYVAIVPYAGTQIKVQLQMPKGTEVPHEYRYGGVARASLDISSLSVIKNDSYRRYLLSEGYQATGYVQNITSYAQPRSAPLTSLLQRLRAELIANFETATPQHLTLQERGLIYALTLGDRSHLPQEVKHSFTASGVAHILAVSGYHLGVVYGVVVFFLSLLFYRYKYRHLRYALIIVSLFGYTLLTGASTATVRAFVMVLLFVLHRLLGRPHYAVQVLSLTFLSFLMVQPYSVYSAGLLLSLSAVWGIHTFVPIFRYYISPSFKPLIYITNLLFVTISAQVAVLPLLLYYFGSTSLAFMWSNVPLITLSGLLIPYSLFLLLLSAFAPTLPLLLVQVAKLLVGAMIDASHYFALLTKEGGLELKDSLDLPLLIFSYAFIVGVYNIFVERINRRHSLFKQQPASPFSS